MRDLPPHLIPVEIPPATLRRWIEVAMYIARAEPVVFDEVQALRHDATPHRLQRCIKAARWVEKAVDDEGCRIHARRLADEMEHMRQEALTASAKAS